MCNEWRPTDKGARRRHKPGKAYKCFATSNDGGLRPSFLYDGYTLKEGDCLVWNDDKHTALGYAVRVDDKSLYGFCAYTSREAAKRHLKKWPDDIAHEVHFEDPVGTMSFPRHIGFAFQMVVFRKFIVGKQL